MTDRPRDLVSNPEAPAVVVGTIGPAAGCAVPRLSITAGTPGRPAGVPGYLPG